MKTIEQCLRLLPESLWANDDCYFDYVGSKFGYGEGEYPMNNDEAYIAITTNSARYKIHDPEGGHWTDLICFYDKPKIAINQLYDWYVNVYQKKYSND